MKTNLPTHIDRWSFDRHRKATFLEKYDLLIVIAVFGIAYYLIF